MSMTRNYLMQAIAVILLLLCASFGGHQSNRQAKGFLNMKGILTIHSFTTDKIDSLSGQEILELQDTTGITLWFGRQIYKDVCMTGQCKMIRLWLFWDGAGNYLGFEVPDDEPFTKSDHTEFEIHDYDKLHTILSDTSSILKNLKTEDLTVEEKEKNPYEVDGYTAATQPGIKEVVVKDAVYTCHTLWHTVYGPTRDEVLAILDERISEDYLRLLFNSGNPALMSRAISCVEKFPDFHRAFYPIILDAVLSEHPPLSEQALSYFMPSRLSGFDEQMQLANLIPGVGTQKKYDIIWKLVESGKVHEPVVLQLLKYFDNQEIGVGSLNLVYRMVSSEYINRDGEIKSLLQKLAGHENAYIRNLTLKVLNRS
jgi:hypothetical protein